MTRKTTLKPTATILHFRPRALSPFRPEGIMQAEIVPLPARPHRPAQLSNDLIGFFDAGGFSG
jgi:hypothetical protein